MSKWRALVLATMFLLVCGSTVPAVVSVRAESSPAMSLSLTTLPQRLPTSSAGSSAFPALVVSIHDPNGSPVVLGNDTVVYLSTSQSAVLGVQSSITIPGGQQYAIATVTTTATPGNSTVTAVAPGFESASTEFDTFVPRGYPTQLKAYMLPSSFPAGSAAIGTFAVVISDAAGLPARAVAQTSVEATSSNTTVAVVQGGPVLIPTNETIGYGTVSITGRGGVAGITVSASTMVSSLGFITVSSSGRPAVSLGLTAPSQLPADGQQYNVLAVSLLDNRSLPAFAKNPSSTIYLSSSRPDLLQVMNPQMSVSQCEPFCYVSLKTSLGSGAAFITASASNFSSSAIEVSTVSVPPTKLGVYLADDHGIVSQSADTLDLVVQLQDASGTPAEARSPSIVTVSFSNTSLFQSPLTIPIAKGADLAYTSIRLTQSTRGTFSAISNGVLSAFADFSASIISVASNLGAQSPTIHANQTSTVVFSIQSQGLPLSGAKLTWLARGGSLTQATGTTDGTGSGTATFVPTGSGIAVVTVVVSDPVVGRMNSTVDIVVLAVTPKAAPSFLSLLFGYLPYIGAGVAASIIVVIIFLRRRRAKVGEEDSFSIGEAPALNLFGLSTSLS